LFSNIECRGGERREESFSGSGQQVVFLPLPPSLLSHLFHLAFNLFLAEGKARIRIGTGNTNQDPA
jgi:hypothetical protein